MWKSNGDLTKYRSFKICANIHVRDVLETKEANTLWVDSYGAIVDNS